jgi:hypothetical protein
MRGAAQREKDSDLGWHHWKLGATLIVGAYFLWGFLNPLDWRFLDGANILIHEAGHIFFMPLGEFMMVAGGSLFQIIVPAIFAGYFWHQKNKFSCAMVHFWVGESILNVSVYAADAQLMQLPLIGGPDSFHDWHYLLEKTGLLAHTQSVGMSIRAVGIFVVVAGILIGVKSAKKIPADFDLM